MLPLRSLVETRTPAWPLVSSWFASATNRVELLPPDASRRGSVLHALQITTGSPLGAVAHETGGVLVDHGWLRILGGASTTMNDLASWNGLGPRPVGKAIRGLSVVAHDAAGGVFALDRGALVPGKNGVCYLSPDNLRWIPVHRGYSYFLEWACTGDLAGFAGRLRWDGWRDDVSASGPDRGWVASPARWTVEGRHPTRANLRPVPMPSLFALEYDTAAELQAEAVTMPVPEARRFGTPETGRGRRAGH